MNNQQQFEQFYLQVATESFPTGIDADDAFFVFSVFHMYQFILSGPVIDGYPEIRSLHGLTQRGAAEILDIIEGKNLQQSGSHVDWYRKWNIDWNAYEHFGNLSSEERIHLQKIIDIIEKHPFIDRLELDD